MQQALKNINEEKRFEFGRNWANFLKILNEERIQSAEESLKNMLNIDSLNGKKILDIGCGSGLFSLAAKRLGAQVHSFDYDKQAVACAQELKVRYFDTDDDWIIEQGSVLDQDYMKSLGRFDVVYAWGVLHHTGGLWAALENVAINVKEGGNLFIALYNDQGKTSQRWKYLKKRYVGGSYITKKIILLITMMIWWTPGVIRRIFTGKFFSTVRHYVKTKGMSPRGMSPLVDLVDWAGGYPFEVSRPDEVFLFYKKKGFVLENLITCGGTLGNNEFVFTKK